MWIHYSLMYWVFLWFWFTCLESYLKCYYILLIFDRKEKVKKGTIAKNSIVLHYINKFLVLMYINHMIKCCEIDEIMKKYIVISWKIGQRCALKSLKTCKAISFLLISCSDYDMLNAKPFFHFKSFNEILKQKGCFYF